MNQKKYKKILITGGCGFIGTNLSKYLEKNYEILIIDNFYRYGSKFNKSYLDSKNIRIINIDINDKKKLDRIKFNPDIIIHLASETSVTYGLINSPEYLLKTNTIGAMNTLERFKKKNLIFIYLSTSRVYSIDEIKKVKLAKFKSRFKYVKSFINGISKNGINEQFSTNGRKSFYGLSKFFCEDLLREYAYLNDIKVIVNRCGLISGKFQWGKQSQGIMTFLVLNAIKGNIFNITGFHGSGMQVRDFLNVKDLVMLIDKQINKKITSNFEIYNVGGGIENSFSINELIEKLEKLLNFKMKIKRLKKSHQNDIGFYITDNYKVGKHFDWKPMINLDDTLIEITNFVRNNLKIFERSNES